ncbi:MAG: NYN domain-containing protein [Ignavibacteria bacterium]|nr:NYN domain-containing protein [Ignavibacteria bacterium]
MKIGFDVAKLCIKSIVTRILLATSDADFIPAIHFAKTYNVEVVLLSDIDFIKRTKGRLLKAFTSHRLV